MHLSTARLGPPNISILTARYPRPNTVVRQDPIGIVANVPGAMVTVADEQVGPRQGVAFCSAVALARITHPEPLKKVSCALTEIARNMKIPNKSVSESSFFDIRIVANSD